MPPLARRKIFASRNSSTSRRWFGILAPAGTPPAVVTRLDQAIAETLRTPEIVAKLHGGSARMTYLDPADFKACIALETKMFGDIIKKGNIKLN